MRKAKVAADFFVRQPVADQHGFINALNGRVTFPADDAPAVALLDTGVNHGHPLLNQVITEQDLYTHNPAWGVHDTGAHGTGMAGLALYGDLTPIFAGDAPVILRHRLQSHKLINDADRHDPKLYGAVTAEGVARLEVDPAPSRVYCMAITTDGKDRGRPTSWSAAVDNIAFGTDSDRRRLVVLSAGNCSAPANYPNDNFTSSVQDPAQSWNALTVGGTTDKVFVNQEQNPGWQALAPEGDLSPSSTTSMNWPRSPRWPFKPDIVMEAGNMGSGPNNGRMHLDEMLLLTTNDEFAVGQSPLMTFRQTSAATALAARLAASLWAQYPTFTPETIRALLVHSARWTPAMLARYTNGEGVLHTINLLRTYGHGVPNEAALYTSANNALTLIAQSTVQPFIKEEGRIKTRDLNLHALPWPVEALQALPPETQVSLRITLSYFIEPSPGERGWDKKYGYASHGLRFAVKRPTETVAELLSASTNTTVTMITMPMPIRAIPAAGSSVPKHRPTALSIPTPGPGLPLNWRRGPTSRFTQRSVGGRRGRVRDGSTTTSTIHWWCRSSLRMSTPTSTHPSRKWWASRLPSRSRSDHARNSASHFTCSTFQDLLSFPRCHGRRSTRVLRTVCCSLGLRISHPRGRQHFLRLHPRL